MWGTDGVRVFTAEDGWVWTFAAVDHWNAECVGWHVCKVGSRFAALEPVAQGLGRLYGSVEADVARGLALRMDHGSQYLSDHFLNQLRYWGIHPSFGFLEEPETNGVVERWNRTLKEQAIYGRVFQNLADVRTAVAEFVERYNQRWRLEKLAYQNATRSARGVRATSRRVAQTCVQETGCGTIKRPRFLGHGLRENPMAKGVGEMVRSRQVMQAEGSARTEGARRATGVRADAAVAGAGVLGPGQRWSASRKRDVVLRLLRGESLDAVSREVGVEIYRLEEWKERALAGLELGLKDPAGEPAGAALDAAKRHIGELSMENELLRERARAAERRRQGDVPARRGPTPLLSDEQLLAAIRADLARSPFQGEGHRKVHARLRLLDGIRVAQTQVLRVMRTQGLLSPHRGRQGDPKLHDGTIITLAPQVMWGTDGVRVFTVDDGWVWTFAAVDHWNAECVGWHVCKVGSRFAALEPIAQGLRRIYGTVDADVARGLALRMDHGSQYLSDHFLRQIRYWGIRPSFGFLEEPETNGVVERWNRTLKEQAIYGRVFQNLDDVRAAVAEFVERYNQSWRLEKLGYQTPIEAREEYELHQVA